jgi:hypothetical protein
MNKIIRNKNENYTIISNVCVRDNRLSLKAKGLMSLVMSLPDGWDFSIQGLSSIVKEGKSAIYAAINELKDFGYCRVISNRDDKGKIIGNDYTFFEEPCADIPYTENPYTENQDMDNQNMENQDLENQSQINKDIKEIKTEIIEENKDTNVSIRKESKRFVKPTIQEIQAYVFEKGYTFDAEAFFAFYESKGWMVGKNPMKNWKMACTTWQKTMNERNKNNSYGRIKTNTEKFYESIAEANEFSQKLREHIGEPAVICDGDTDEAW